MTSALTRPVIEVGEPPGAAPGRRTARVTVQTVAARRIAAAVLLVGPLIWATHRATEGTAALVNPGGLRLLDDLLATALTPALSSEFLSVVLDAVVLTVEFAVLGTVGALALGCLGGLALSNVAWGPTPSRPIRLARLAVRGVLVAARSLHELVWALLLVSVLGLDPIVGVLAIAIPFGAQTAKVFGETLDTVPDGALRLVRNSGARPVAAFAYALLPGAAPLLVSYSFYRFECAIRSTLLLGVVGIGGLGQELVVSLQSRNWDEVWTLVGAVVILSAAVDLWSTRVRGDLAVGGCVDWSGGRDQGAIATRRGVRRPRDARWLRCSALVVGPAFVAAWLHSGVSLRGLASPRTRELTNRLLDDLWPPALPASGWSGLSAATLDTIAMATLAMAVAVAITLALGPWATRQPVLDNHPLMRVVRALLRVAARATLLVLRSVPPTVWAIVALLALFPGILPGALALGIYTGGIVGRLVAEAWESVDPRARERLEQSGVRRSLATLVAVGPPSAQHLVTYTLYRFEICVRDTAVVGVVGAAGLGRLLAENFAAFRFPVITTLLAASFVVSVGTELLGRSLRRALDPAPPGRL